ncbi:MAG: 3'(2'),5'-bisphosphate nucleotidase CysQ [Sphingobium sp.]|nr:3'(2'),5'-bisphosphate nucleotidase CysQ [Sphingobium sp.]
MRGLVEIVTRAADHALTLWGGGSPKLRQWEKEPGQPVCEADIAVDTMLQRDLMALAPDAGWLSEETADDGKRLEAQRLWVVDPIDGTKDYIAGKPGWAVSVALVEQGKVVAGILAAPARNELWIAQAGRGAQRNGQPLRTGARQTLAGARVPTEKLPREDADMVMVPRPNSIALRMALVAADEADIVATARWGNEWDIAAAALIARESGACVTDALGKALLFNQPQASAFGILCCAPGIFDEALNRLSTRTKRILARSPSPKGV